MPGKMLMRCQTGLIPGLFFAFIITLSNGKAYSQNHIIGEVERVYELSPEIGNIVGMAFQDDERGEYLHIFEGTSRKIHTLKVDGSNRDLVYQNSTTLEGTEITNPRGLAYAKEVSGDVFYFLDYVVYLQNGVYKKKGLLYRYDLTGKDLTFVDLSNTAFNLEGSPVFALTKQGGNVFLSFDPSSLESYTERIRRGLAVLRVDDGEYVTVVINSKSIKRPRAWQEALEGDPVITKQMPGPGKEISGGGVETSLSLAAMTIDGTDYLWGTVGNDYIYIMDSQTGRGLFYFNRPGSKAFPFDGLMTYGARNLWVAEKASPGIFIIHRINVLDNPQIPYTGPKTFREMRMQLTSTVNADFSAPRGSVYHTFCHPYASDATGNQGVVPNSIRVNDMTGVTDYTVEQLYLDPAGDSDTRQHYTLVSYLTDRNPSVRQYRTELFIKFWTRECRYFVYPHLAFRDDGPEGTRYLEDDLLYGIKSDPGSYQSFINRVREAIAEEYNTTPDMDNPYWAAVNILEYVVENYHYPVDDAGYYATYDFNNHDYNSHPGNKKAAYSADSFYADNIIACSGTGTMTGGALRYIGIPSLWLGTSSEVSLTEGFFRPENNEAQVSNGHRYNKVWLGSLYKWQDIDATPRVPAGNAFNSKPKEMSQWELMQKAFFKVSPRRIIHNLQSEFWEKLYVPFRNSCENSVNTCGSTRYNLLGSYEYPGYFNLSNQVMRLRGIQFIENVNIEVDELNNAAVTWQETGEWDLDSEARLMIIVEKQCLPAETCYPGFKEPIVVATDIPSSRKSATIALSQLTAGTYRMTVRKVADQLTGNSISFELKDLATFAGQLQGDKISEIYPNPSSGTIHINRENVVRVEVFDMNGRLVLIQNNSITGGMDLSKMSRGQYVFRINTKEDSFTEKVMLY
jgi:hypothetical protein